MVIRKTREQRTSGQRIWDATRAGLRGPRGLIAIIAAWIGVNAIVLLWPADTTDKRHYETIASIWSSATVPRQPARSAEEWDAFVAESTETLTPVIAELEEDASPRYPAKQHLLWASRDCLIPLLRGKSFDQLKFLDHMATARRHIRQAGQDVPELVAQNNSVTGTGR